MISLYLSRRGGREVNPDHMFSHHHCACLPLLVLALLPLLATCASTPADPTTTAPSTTSKGGPEWDYDGPLDSDNVLAGDFEGPLDSDNVLAGDFEGPLDSDNLPAGAHEERTSDQLRFEENLHGVVRMLKPLKPVPVAQL